MRQVRNLVNVFIHNWMSSKPHLISPKHLSINNEGCWYLQTSMQKLCVESLQDFLSSMFSHPHVLNPGTESGVDAVSTGFPWSSEPGCVNVSVNAVFCYTSRASQLCPVAVEIPVRTVQWYVPLTPRSPVLHASRRAYLLVAPLGRCSLDVLCINSELLLTWWFCFRSPFQLSR